MYQQWICGTAHRLIPHPPLCSSPFSSPFSPCPGAHLQAWAVHTPAHGAQVRTSFFGGCGDVGKGKEPGRRACLLGGGVRSKAEHTSQQALASSRERHSRPLSFKINALVRSKPHHSLPCAGLWIHSLQIENEESTTANPLDPSTYTSTKHSTPRLKINQS